MPLRPSLRPAALALAALALLAPPALAQDAGSLELVNATDLTVMEFYAAPGGTAAWGDDALGAGVIAPGETGLVPVPAAEGTCEVDLRFVMDDGQEVVDTVDACAAPTYTLSM